MKKSKLVTALTLAIGDCDTQIAKVKAELLGSTITKDRETVIAAQAAKLAYQVILQAVKAIDDLN